eukprot:11205198-Lingulodinium_polyedra.AAC.1
MQRSCVLSHSSKQTRLECVLSADRRVLQEALDMGPMSWPIRAAMYTTFNTRGCYTFDVHHR